MRPFITVLLLYISAYIHAQQTIHIYITDKEDSIPVSASIIIKGTTSGYNADSLGNASIFYNQRQIHFSNFCYRL